MKWQDIVNGLYECGGGFLMLNNCRAVLRDRAVAGISIVSSALFTSWGFWNVYYYPTLGQWMSFAGGIWLALTNVAYVALLIKYARRA